MNDPRIRSKGRHKLGQLVREALDVCAKYQHPEYAADFDEIRKSLMHDEDVEDPKQN